MAESEEKKSNVVVVDMGKKKKKLVKRLREGRGQLMDEVRDALASLETDGTAKPGDTVVVVVERKSKKLRSPFKW